MMLMLRRLLLSAIVVVTLPIPLSGQVDIAAIGPRVGAPAPPFSGVDQFGATHSLQSIVDRKGAMLVFFRSADW